MQKPDILIFMTDQHTPLYSGFMGGKADTPNMDKLCEDGTSFSEAYTSCPLCVPARLSMLSALRSSNTGIFTNLDALPDVTPTFLHNLVEAGYETVLCGRMHFIGKDQRHGFMKRIAKDITPVTWSRPFEKLHKERGVFTRTFGARWSTEVIGGGESPVLHYDEYVISRALEYLSKPHDKPICMVVGVYAPHFPYVAPEELFGKYWERTELPDSWLDETEHPLLKRYVQQDADEDTVRGALAAYLGMIENVDLQLGKVRDAFDRYCINRGMEGIFCYISDHGDLCGDRKMFGKQTFFEKSAKIPLIFAGNGIAKNKKTYTPVSIMDLGPTLLDLVEARPMMDVDGKSLSVHLKTSSVYDKEDDKESIVYCEFLERTDGGNPHGIRENAEYSYGLMVRYKQYKLMTYTGYEEYDLLYDLEKDPEERTSIAATQPEILKFMRELAVKIGQPDKAIKLQKKHDRAAELFIAYEKALGSIDESERWQDNPETARINPKICVRGL
ncbi:MAG: sulfatase-like hydrolase/transferase [Clostridiaceae bacterium]|nr:sulfatase-like hydrolase/transferase [Clostridiaceae bacterium]